MLPELVGGDVDEPAARAGEVPARLGQPDPLHQREAGLQGHLVPGVACGEETSGKWSKSPDLWTVDSRRVSVAEDELGKCFGRTAVKPVKVLFLVSTDFICLHTSSVYI